MNVSSVTQTQYANNIYTSNINKDDNFKEGFQLEELLDEDGYEFFNGLLNGMEDEEQTNIKLMLSFMLNVKGETFVDGKIQMHRESSLPDAESILNKLERLSKSKNRTDEMNYVINELKAFYTDKVQNNISVNNQEDSLIDDFLEDLFSKKSIASASSLVKEDMKNKVDEYATTIDKELDDAEKSKILNEYKKELLNEYKETLEDAKNDKITLQQQAIIKTLLDENKKESSSLEKLLAIKTDSTKGGANYYMENLDAKGNEIINNIISGRTEAEKLVIKGIIDRQLNFENTEAYAMAVEVFNKHNGITTTQTTINSSKPQNILATLDRFIERQSQSSVDELGLLEIAKQLRSEYASMNNDEVSSNSSTNVQQTSKTSYERHMDALKDNTNTFGLFIKENNKAMSVLDEFTKNMTEGEKGRFMFVFGGVGRESILKAAFERGISPSQAIPYIQDEIASYKDNTVFAKALEKVFNDKNTPDDEVKHQFREFYELYTA